MCRTPLNLPDVLIRNFPAADLAQDAESVLDAVGRRWPSGVCRQVDEPVDWKQVDQYATAKRADVHRGTGGKTLHHKPSAEPPSGLAGGGCHARWSVRRCRRR